MGIGYQIERRKGQLDTGRHIPIELVPDAGEVIAKIDFLALTSNNLTYAVFGDPPMRYWDFFPATAPEWGIVPMWGYATITESRCPEIAVGTRYFGYWPAATHLRLQPGHIGAHGFTDIAAHRAELPPVYNQYQIAHSAQPADEEMMATFFPLFGTGYVLANLLSDSATDKQAILLTSASSKTALATAFQLTNLGHPPIGLTSAQHLETVRLTGYYAQVLTYEQIEMLDRIAPILIADFSGDGPRLHQLHTHLTGLQATHMIGFTHWNAGLPPSDLPGPAPQMFFAPDHWAARAQAIGAQAFHTELENARLEFQKDAKSWFHHRHISGANAFDAGFGEIMRGHLPADHGLLWRP